MNEIFCPSLRFKDLTRHSAKVSAFFAHELGRAGLGSISQSLCLFRVFQVHLYKTALGMSVKKQSKTSCVFIALAVKCRALGVLFPGCVAQIRTFLEVQFQKTDTRPLKQPVENPSCSRVLICLVNVGSSKEHLDGIIF